jgi:hypothetical protein
MARSRHQFLSKRARCSILSDGLASSQQMTPTLTNEISGICSSAAGDSEPSMFLQATLESYKIAIYDLEISSGGCLRVSRQRYGIQDDTFGFAWSPEADLDIQISDYNGT